MYCNPNSLNNAGRKDMTKAQSQRMHVKNVLTKDQYNDLLKAAEITSGKKIKLGMFITTSLEEYAKVVKLVEPYIDHHDSLVRGTAKNIKAKAREISRDGFLGGGMFLAE
jgi:hypothetical protein